MSTDIIVETIDHRGTRYEIRERQAHLGAREVANGVNPTYYAPVEIAPHGGPASVTLRPRYETLVLAQEALRLYLSDLDEASETEIPDSDIDRHVDAALEAGETAEGLAWLDPFMSHARARRAACKAIAQRLRQCGVRQRDLRAEYPELASELSSFGLRLR